MNTLEKKQLHSMVARRIKEVRTQKGMNQHGLAQAVGCTQSLISQYESAVAEVYLDQILKICEALGCSVDYLLGREISYDISTCKGKLLAAFEQLSTSDQQLFSAVIVSIVAIRKKDT